MTRQLLCAVAARAERRSDVPRRRTRASGFTWLFGRSVRATRAESTRLLPGDALIAEPIGSLTHAITIRRHPSDIWPWIAQMGAGSRAGWYSYDFLDNGGQPSAASIVPELQALQTGMVFPALPNQTEAFKLLGFRSDRFLILAAPSPDGSPLVTRAFVLGEEPRGWTRLVVRARGRRGYRFLGLPQWLGNPIVGLVHFIMQRKQLLEIARRAEQQCTPDNTIETRAQHVRRAA